MTFNEKVQRSLDNNFCFIISFNFLSHFFKSQKYSNEIKLKEKRNSNDSSDYHSKMRKFFNDSIELLIEK